MFKDLFRKPIFWLSLIIIVYMILLLPTVGLYGITSDEQTDIEIAYSYISGRGGWIHGSPLDPSQTRLPMYFVAIIFSLLKTKSLLSARLVSCIMGAFTIIGVYVFCKRKYDYRKGLLACLILATSPYFLSFSRIAFTEADIFVTCTLVWVLICVSILQEKRTVGWATVTAIVLGLALSSKISAIAVFPAIFLALMFFFEDKPWLENASIYKNNLVITGSLLALLSVSIFGGWGIVYLNKTISYSGWFKLGHYFLVFLCWMSIVIYFYFHRKFLMNPLMLSFFVLTFSFLTFMVIPPVHTTNPNIFLELQSIFFSQYTKLNLTFIPEFAILHFGCVLFKSSLVIGALLWFSLFMTIIQCRYRKEVRLPLLIYIFYSLFLIKMPLAQPFYMVPLLPILAIFASDQFFRLYVKKRFCAIVVSSLAVCLLIIDMFLCYPDYNLNGFQWLGARHFCGRSSIGAMSIVNVAFDGVEQVLKWVNNNVESGEIIVTYLLPDHILRAVCPHPKFQIINGFKEPKSILMNADYVIIAINAENLGGYGNDNPIYKYPYDVELLKANFTKVFSIKRAFNIEVASVLRRNVVQGEVK